MHHLIIIFMAFCLLLPVNLSLADSPSGKAENQSLQKNAVNISDFSAKADSRENTVLAVRRALEFCKNIENPVLLFSKGR